jgi:hypothetical protein
MQTRSSKKRPIKKLVEIKELNYQRGLPCTFIYVFIYMAHDTIFTWHVNMKVNMKMIVTFEIIEIALGGMYGKVGVHISFLIYVSSRTLSCRLGLISVYQLNIRYYYHLI